ncbi:MAG: hypothetical protein R2720_07235 [Candidatus Nanopelagicales bacterium]
MLTSDDRLGDAPAIMGLRHAPVGTSSRKAIRSTATLLLPVLDSTH